MSLEQEITLPSLLAKLQQNGYESLREIKEASVYDLTQELELNKEEVSYIIKISGKDSRVKRKMAETIEIEKNYSISTGCKNLNTLLGYGVPPLKMTEICGESGSGKSQLCMQLAVNVQLEGKGECIYIDTEGSFQPSRVIQFAKDHVIEPILRGIHVFRVLDHTELIGLVRQLPDILQEYSKVKLIIIDSIVYHFRLNAMDARARSAMLDYFARFFIELASIHQLAVVVTNHVTTDGVDQSWTPSLGSSWGFWCSNRLFLYRKKEYRYGYLYKSFENAGSQPVPFCIKDEGIVDPVEDELELVKQETETEMNQKIESTWEELKNQHIKEEANAEHARLDDLWDGTFDEAMDPMDPAAESPLKQLPAELPAEPLLAVSKQNNDKKRTAKEDQAEKKRKLDPVIEKDESIIDIFPHIPSSEDCPKLTDDDYWASDQEEELDMDFLENVRSYF